MMARCSQMLAVRREHAKILRSIVRRIVIQMMDALASSQRPADLLLSDDEVL